MFRLVLFLVSIVLFLSGCVKTGQIDLGGCAVVAVPQECEEPEIALVPKLEVVVTDESGDAKGTRDGGGVTVRPLNLCVIAGSTITVDIKDDAGVLPGVAILPKRFRDTWLVKSSAKDENQIHIKVPDDAGDPAKDADDDGWVEYDYSIVTSQGGCVDPRFHVRN